MVVAQSEYQLRIHISLNLSAETSSFNLGRHEETGL